MKFAHIKAKLSACEWYATPELVESIVSTLNAATIPTVAAFPKPEQSEACERASGGIAVLNAFGPIGKRLGMMEAACGGVDIDKLRADFDAANADPAVSGILMHFDSGGGTSTGVPELFAHITSTKSKPLVAYSDGQMCSAAYYLAAAADAIYASETAMVGSIGSIIKIKNMADAAGKAGMTVHTFKSGKYKGAGDPLTPLTDEAKEMFQGIVDVGFKRFKRDMLSNRPNIEAKAFEAFVYNGNSALPAGLIDGIANTRAEVLKLFTAT